MKGITVILLFMLPLLIVGQDLNNPSTLGQRNRNQKFPKGVQVEDTTLLKGAVWLPGFTHGGDSVLTVTGGFLQLVPAGGATGPTGATGATGPTGPAGLGAAEEIIYDTLTARITAKKLTPGANYIFTDFQSYHKPGNQFSAFGFPDTTYAPGIEPLVLTATSDSTIAERVYSLNYPGDVLHYEPFPLRQAERGMTKGMITYRKSPNNIAAHYDWRTVRVRRFEDAIGSGLFNLFVPPVPDTSYAHEDVLTLQNLEARDIVNVELPPVSDSVVNYWYTSFFGLDLWNNNTVLKFPATLIVNSNDEGNIRFETSVINSHFDFHAYAITQSQFNNVTFAGPVRNVRVFHDTTTSYNTTSVFPKWNNVVFMKGMMNSVLKNTLIEDAHFLGNAQTWMANTIFFSHHVQNSNIGVTGSDTCYMDSVFTYVAQIDQITSTETYPGPTSMRAVSIGQSKLKNLQGNHLRRVSINRCDGLSLLGVNSFGDHWSSFFNFTGDLLFATIDSVNFVGVTGAIYGDTLQHLFIENSDLKEFANFRAMGEDTNRIEIIGTQFFGGSDNFTIDSRGTQSGSINNSVFYGNVNNVTLGVPVLKSTFINEMPTMTTQSGTFNNNVIAATTIPNNPTLAELWTGTSVTAHTDGGGGLQYTWIEGDELKGYPLLYGAVTADSSRALNMGGYDWSVTGFGTATLSGDRANVTVDTMDVVGVVKLDAGTGPGITISTATSEQRFVEFYDRPGQAAINTDVFAIVDPDTNGNYIQITQDELKEASAMYFVSLVNVSGDIDTLEIPAPNAGDLGEITIKNLGAANVLLVTDSGIEIDGTTSKLLPPMSAIRFRQYTNIDWIITGYYEP